MNRETIMAALFALVSSMPGLVTKSRKPRFWEDVLSAEKPALFLAAGDQEPRNDASGAPVTWTLHATLFLYVDTSGSDLPPSAALNVYLDRLDVLLSPPCPGAPWPAGFQSLGGLVRHVWIDGQVETSGDLLGDQGIAIVPLSLLVAA